MDYKKFAEFFENRNRSDFYQQRTEINKYFEDSVKDLAKTVEAAKKGVPKTEELERNLKVFEDFDSLVDQIHEEPKQHFYRLLGDVWSIINRTITDNPSIKDDLKKIMNDIKDIFGLRLEPKVKQSVPPQLGNEFGDPKKSEKGSKVEEKQRSKEDFLIKKLKTTNVLKGGK